MIGLGVDVRKALLCMILAACVIPAHASNWMQVTAGGDGVEYLDSQSIVKSGGRVKVWTKYVFKQPHFVGEETKLTAYEVTHLEYDCKERTVWSSSSTRYDDEGSVIRSIDGIPSMRTDVVPDSIGETVLNAVCR
ncbi:surface-adhesin E family protein [Paraburkholderia flagellata]|uniref:surface-adhesin E family protein n=1 Tax=Paraburkholderia flagellata TaxID=2883241 RepID=UPI003570E2E6